MLIGGPAFATFSTIEKALAGRRKNFHGPYVCRPTVEEWALGIEVNDNEHSLFLALSIRYCYVHSVEQNAWVHFSDYRRPVTYSINMWWECGQINSSLPFSLVSLYLCSVFFVLMSCGYVSTVFADICIDFCKLWLVFCAVRLYFAGEDDAKTFRPFSFPWHLIFSDIKWKCLSVTVFVSDIDGIQNKVLCLWIGTTCSVNVMSTCSDNLYDIIRRKPSRRTPNLK